MTDRPSRPPAPPLIGRSFLHRELVFVLVLSACGVLAFLGTRALAESNAAVRRKDAAAWYERGREMLTSGDTAAALRALRRSARIDSTNRDVSFALAAALQAAGKPDEGVQILTSLRDSQPDDPEANIELARLELARNNFPQAARHYQDALDALWMPQTADQGRALRVEFIRALLDHGERGRALAQTLVLAAELPAGPADQIQAGRLFLAAGDPRRALDRFSAALVEDPQNAAAMTGAGEASFELGDYQRAVRHLAASESSEVRIVEMREVAALMLAADPLAPRLGRRDRSVRIDQVLEHAGWRLDACAPANRDSDPERTALRKEIASLAESNRPLLRGEDGRDRAEDAVELAIRVERATTSCGPADTFSRAVPLIARDHRLEGPR